MNDGLVWGLLALGVLTLCLVAWMAVGLARARNSAVDAELQRKELQDLRAQLQTGHERLERELRREIAESSQGARQELSQNLATFQQTLTQQGAEATRTQNTHRCRLPPCLQCLCLTPFVACNKLAALLPCPQ